MPVAPYGGTRGRPQAGRDSLEGEWNEGGPEAEQPRAGGGGGARI